MTSADILSILNFLVLSATLVFIAKYTFITNKLHITSQNQLAESIKQRQLSLIPLIHLTLLPHGDGHKIFLTNVGNGVATNIQINDLHYDNEILKDMFYRFTEIPMLRPTELAPVESEFYVEGKIHESGLLSEFTRSSKTDYPLTLTFQDLIGDRFEERYQLGLNGVKYLSLKPLGSASKR